MTRLPLAEARAALGAGQLVVVFVAVAGGIEAARAASRSACQTLLAAAGSQGVHASRSATPGLGAVALWQGGPVGVDVERVRPEIIDDVLLALALHPSERASPDAREPDAFFARWVRKEALLKSLGTGLALPPAEVHAGSPGEDWELASAPDKGKAYLRNLSPAPGIACAVAAGRTVPVRQWHVGEASLLAAGAG